MDYCMKANIIFCLLSLAAATPPSQQDTLIDFIHRYCTNQMRPASTGVTHRPALQPRVGKAGPAGPRGPPGIVNYTAIGEKIVAKCLDLEARNDKNFERLEGIIKARSEIGDSAIEGIRNETAESTKSIKEYQKEVKTVLLSINEKLIAMNESFRNQDLTVSKAVDCFMGMKSGSIPDSAITASSFYDANHGPERARLDIQRDNDGRRGAWSAATPERNGWIQVDLGTALSVAGIISQGRADYPQWVKSYKVQFGNSTDSLQYVSSGGSIKIYNANTDQNTKVVNIFPRKLTFRFIRIYPETWWKPNGSACMRFELIRGECFAEYYIFQ